ncbi:MAG: hypothetical protein ACRBB6_10590 [Neptuniibacter sp.]
MYSDCPRVADWFTHCMNLHSYQQALAGDFGPEVPADLRAKGEPAWEIIERYLIDINKKALHVM